MVQDVGSVSCVVEIYGYEGGSLTLTSDNDCVLSCIVQKSIAGGSAGQFAVKLAPGGPGGTQDIITWSQIITPGSLAVIGMQRGDVASIVMIGVVTGIIEEQDWEQATDQHVGVLRTQTVQGQDFTWFFTNFNWAILSTLAMTAATALGNSLGSAAAGVPTLAGGMNGSLDPHKSNPAQLAHAW